MPPPTDFNLSAMDTLRAKVTEGINLASAAKTAVAEYVISQDTFPTTNAEAGLTGTITGSYVSGVTVGANGIITATYSGPSEIDGKTIVFTPTTTSGSVTWVCDTGGTAAKNFC